MARPPAAEPTRRPTPERPSAAVAARSRSRTGSRRSLEPRSHHCRSAAAVAHGRATGPAGPGRGPPIPSRPALPRTLREPGRPAPPRWWQQLPVPYEHAWREPKIAGRPAGDIETHRGRILDEHRSPQRLGGDQTQTGGTGLVQQPPEAAADRAKGKPGAARQGVACAGSGCGAELQQQLTVLGHIGPGDEVQVVPADPARTQ